MEDILTSLGVNLKVVAAQSVAFVLLLVVLIKYLYRPVEEIMRQRQEQIANSLEGAEAQRTQAESLRKEYEGHLAQIADEARAKMEQAMKDADATRLRMIASTQEELKGLHERSQAQLALDREQLRRDLRTEMSDIAVMAASRALRSQLTPDLQSAVIDQVIREFDQPAGQSPIV
ncbi:MAG TPA: F0F1 ATP synthase subunit B [Armatimonadota bacterium]